MAARVVPFRRQNFPTRERSSPVPSLPLLLQSSLISEAHRGIFNDLLARWSTLEEPARGVVLEIADHALKTLGASIALGVVM